MRAFQRKVSLDKDVVRYGADPWAFKLVSSNAGMETKVSGKKWGKISEWYAMEKKTSLFYDCNFASGRFGGLNCFHAIWIWCKIAAA